MQYFNLVLHFCKWFAPLPFAVLLTGLCGIVALPSFACAADRANEVVATEPQDAGRIAAARRGTTQSEVARVAPPALPVGSWPEGTNRPPYAIADSFVTTEGVELVMNAPGLLGNDFDLDGDTLRLLSSSTPANGTFTLLVTNGAFGYEPDPGFVGTEAMTYRMDDAPGNETDGVWFIEVLPNPNRPPTAIEDYYATVVNTPLAVSAPGMLANDVDPDGDQVILNSAGGLAHGLFIQLVTSGAFTYVPDPGFSGSDSFTYLIRDDDGLTGEGVAFIQVIDPFGPPPADADMDAVLDNEDNCSLVPNGDQRDTDNDGFGNACDPDLNGDCVVNFTDLGEMKLAFFSDDPHADLDGNGAVNFADLGIMKQQFFSPPGPSGIPNACSPATLALETFGDFDVPRTGGWSTASGGPAEDAGEHGLDDHALLYTATGGFHVLHPAGGQNPNNDFLGNYTARNVTALRFRARHTGIGDPVTLRVVLFDDFGEGTDWAQTAATVTVASTATSWQDYTLSLRAADLSAGGDNGLPVTAILGAVAQLGLRHDPAGTGPGIPVPVANPTSVLFDDVALIADPLPGNDGLLARRAGSAD